MDVVRSVVTPKADMYKERFCQKKFSVQSQNL